MDYKLTKGMGTVKYAAAGNALMTARDFMRVGYLMLHEGDWKGNSILPAAWLQHFTASTAYINMRSNRDCYWGTQYPADLYRTTGSGQNWVLVVPSLDLLLSYNGRTGLAQAGDRPGVARAPLRRGHRALRGVRRDPGERRCELDVPLLDHPREPVPEAASSQD